MLLHSKILGNSSKHILILHGFLGSGDNWISIAKKLSLNGFSVHLIAVSYTHLRAHET